MASVNGLANSVAGSGLSLLVAGSKAEDWKLSREMRGLDFRLHWMESQHARGFHNGTSRLRWSSEIA